MVLLAGYGLVVGARHLRAGWPEADAAQVTRSLSSNGALDPDEPFELSIASNANGTFLGMKDELLMDRMKAGDDGPA